jgi:ribosomal protein L16/L10AE
MGKGAGNIALWVMDIKVGQILLEISAITIKIARKILVTIAGKLPIKSEFIFKKLSHNDVTKD